MADSRSTLPRRSPGRPTQQAASALRELYLQAAFETFLDKGYARAGIDEIARRARAGKMTFYRAFGSKEELFRLVVRRAILKVRDKLQAPLNTDGEPEQVLAALIERLHAGMTDPEYLQLLRLVVAETDRFPELGEALLADDNFLVEPVIDYLTRAAARGDLAIADPYAAAMQLSALAGGGARFLMKKPSLGAERRAQWVQAILKFVMDAWRPDRGSNLSAGASRRRKLGGPTSRCA